jgi:hypothetical protein
MNRVERMNVQDGFDIFTITGQLIDFPPHRTAQRIGIEKDELAAGLPHQRDVCPDIDYAADPV